MKRFTAVVAAMLLACFICGCVTSVTTKNEPRTRVRFTSPAAAGTFYDAYLEHEFGGSRCGTNTISHTVTISIRLPYWQYDRLTENVRFNHAVELADANHDGIISDAEAQAYAAKVLPQNLAARKN